MDTTAYVLTAADTWVNITTALSLTTGQSYLITVEGGCEVQLAEDATSPATAEGHVISRDNGITWTQDGTLKVWCRPIGGSSVIVVSDAQ